MGKRHGGWAEASVNHYLQSALADRVSSGPERWQSRTVSGTVRHVRMWAPFALFVFAPRARAKENRTLALACIGILSLPPCRHGGRCLPRCSPCSPPSLTAGASGGCQPLSLTFLCYQQTRCNVQPQVGGAPVVRAWGGSFDDHRSPHRLFHSDKVTLWDHCITIINDIHTEVLFI